ncbi:uncharacterized protein J7T54_005059 [Emericellopsis cladophorae]|uniref:T6SS Phospholipase effector Tle1-like catalytic domain-containing protein n=1 Tax=Emericellopsis cladophorae TaxID=2686198 RepID=A0A9Q0BBI6_9HYPO|nr:uncharacterized protein J7T54_005059 [Emericellopsis cladophorae]KAI6778535.1 hypothetical protein J7T54_005059 [Emericellopsis cladophorae]
MRRIIVMGDGTWCGRETGTQSNIYHLARFFDIRIDNLNLEDEYTRTTPTIAARYRHGVGLKSTFLDYLFNGVTAQDLAAECISAYKFIVHHYKDGDEVMLFGLSRGAYTVRCVAGMINNCGIIRKPATDTRTDLLCDEVYRLYRSRYHVNAPHSEQSVNFRERHSWPLIGDEAKDEPPRRPPVRFMGLFDTVGSLGIPTFTGGVGLDWPEFYDQNVSSVVEEVYHLVSLHDRFWVFQPCLASRKDNSKSNIHEEWIPGVHYDLGRQRFRFLRIGAGWLESWLGRWSYASKVIEPNQVLADSALLKMLKRVQQVTPDGSVMTEAAMDDALGQLQRGMTASKRAVGDGDVYGKVAHYAPFGERLGGLLLALFKSAPAIWTLLFALRDRLIPHADADVSRFNVPGIDGRTLADLAGVDDQRYPSKTLESWQLRRN